MTINEKQDEIIEEFSELEDWMDRYQLLIDLGEEQEALPAEDKSDQNLIDGCQGRFCWPAMKPAAASLSAPKAMPSLCAA